MHAKQFSESLAPNVLSIHLVEMVARVLGEKLYFCVWGDLSGGIED